MEHSFPCENLALDLVGTLRARRNEAPMEMLGSPGSLDAWFRESGVADGDTGAQAADVVAAVALREAIYTLVAARLAGAGGAGYDEDALALVNRVASVPPAVPRLTPDGRAVEATAEQALSSVARVAIDVLGRPDATLLKECHRPECTQVFIDRSRGFRREWCSMATCGNKVKGSTYRARKRGNLPVPRPR